MKVLAFDLGASSGRGILAEISDGKIKLEEIHRFANNGTYVCGTLYWDILYLYDQIKQGIVKAKLKGGFDTVGIDTWGVDFGFVNKDGELMKNPVHYRDKRTDDILDEFFKVIPKEELYRETGIQILNFNTVFQLFYLLKNKPEDIKNSDKMLFIPDLLNYFLTGVKKNEYTIASTSQMLNPNECDWNTDLLERAGIDKNILCDIVKPGTILGNLSDEVCEELGTEPKKVVAVASHDTASAVVSVPTEEDDFVYISCGTWSLFGTELKKPVISERSLLSSYTNEGGYDGTIRFLTNIMGLWLIQESRRTWIKQGMDVSFNDLEKAALECEPFKCFIDPDFADFGKPGDIPKRVSEFCERTGQYVPKTMGEVMRCIYESLALKYKHAFNNLKDISGKDFKSINIVGGGTKDPLLCQMTANACDIMVTAGPVEATALGNIAVQFMALGEIKDIKEARRIIKNSFEIKSYEPVESEKWNEAYERFVKILG